MLTRNLCLSLLLVCAATFVRTEDRPTRKAEKIEDARLENAHQLTEKVVTGAQPLGEPAFQALADLGIKTVISVDGATPDLEAAHKFGLRYVHLPIGYDGVPLERAQALAKAIAVLDGPVYIHCHHGKHRGPAAAATACVIAGELTHDEAVASMKVLGTADKYVGLWNSARKAKPMPAEELRALHVEFRETAPIPPLAEAMVHVDCYFECLSDSKKAGWKLLPDHPDIDPPHEALKLREVFTEIMRTDEFKKRPADYRAWMKETEQLAERLEHALAERKKGRFEGDPAPVLNNTYEALKANCNACHTPYRNAPAE